MASSRPSMLACALFLFCVSFISSPLVASNARLAHTMTVELRPASGELDVVDVIRIDHATPQFEFVLNAGFEIASANGELEALETSDDGLRRAYRVTLQTPGDSLKLQYHGKPRFSGQRSLGGMPQGIIAAEGVYLDGASAWYPQFGRDLDSLAMTLDLPEGWQGISIGRRDETDGRVTWTTDRPHDNLYLIAGRFTRYARKHGDIDLSVWLLDDDPALAARYLGVMGDYVDRFSHLIGPYPYAKFAVVENHWQTGYGMPSFTLLGSRVMRLPFIPYTSLPHEILHNWWGNGVWIDYRKGNWSEGLTAYLADHWMQAREGKGDQYRLKALQRYSNFAARGEDTPLIDFVSRHNDATQSIGYSKSLMLFHMLRRALGDEAFIAGLQRLWQDHRYQRIGFAEAVRAIGGSDPAVAERFMPWLIRTGAPDIRLEDTQLRPLDQGWELTLTIRQDQKEPFEFELPLAVTLQGEPMAHRELARVAGTRSTLRYRFTSRPLRLDVDPEYDVLRYLDSTEQPPALNRLFGSDKGWLVIPSAAPAAMQGAWRELASLWRGHYPQLRVIEDRMADELPPEADRLLLGWDNALLPAARAGFVRDDQRLDGDGLSLGDTRYAADTGSVVLANNDARGVATGFVGAPTPAAVRTLARKLTHYGSYGRLVFDAEGNNQVRDTLTSSHSRLTRQFGQEPVPLRLPARAPLGGGD